MAPRYNAKPAQPGNPRRAFLLARLQEADGPAYDELVREIAEAFPEGRAVVAGILAVRTVRKLLFEGCAATEPDESVWLTPEGWQRAGAVRTGRRPA